MNTKKIPVEQISQLANDIRLIKDFSENHDFDNTLLTVNKIPEDNKKDNNSSLYTMIFFIVLVIITIAIIMLSKPPLSQSLNNFLFILGLIFSIIASIATHIKFKDLVVTSITIIGLLMVLSIGTGIFTAKEAINKVEKFVK